MPAPFSPAPPEPHIRKVTAPSARDTPRNAPLPSQAGIEQDSAGPRPTAAGLRAAKQTRLAATTVLLALACLCVLWERWLAPAVPGGSWVLAAKCLPLLIALPGVLRMRMYTYRWLSLLVWLYLAEGAVRATDPGLTRWLALAEVALALALFAACTLHIRLRFRHARAGAASPRASAR